MSSSTSPAPKHDELPSAHSLSDAANSGDTLLGYAAMNDPEGESELARYAMEHPRDEHHEIAKLAYQFYLEREGAGGSAEEDWHRAEQQIRANRTNANR